MKLNTLLLGLFIVVILQSCTNKAEQTSSNQLSEQMKNQISSEIMEVSNQWINGNKNLNADKAIQFWSNSPDLRFAENGQFFANRDSIYATLNNYYSITNTLNVEWLNRKISPLSNSTALMSGEFHFRLNFKDGSSWQGTNAFTGVFIKENGEWSLIQGQETTRTNE